MSIKLISGFFARFGKYGTTIARVFGYAAILAGGAAAKKKIVDPIVDDTRTECVERGCPAEEIEQTEQKAYEMAMDGVRFLIKRICGDKLPQADDESIIDVPFQEGQPQES